MNIAVIGTGYVGLVTGTCLADIGHHVLCIDTDSHKLSRIVSGDLPIFEPGLDELVAQNIERQRLAFHNTVPDLADYDAVFIAVGTPSNDEGDLDLEYVKSAATSIAPKLSGHTTVVIKSTVPPGTAELVETVIAEWYLNTEIPPFTVVSNPEFLKEGDAVRDFMKPARVVVVTVPAQRLSGWDATRAPVSDSASPTA